MAVCFISFEWVPGNRIARSYGNWLTFEELPNCFPKGLHHLLFPPAMYEGSSFPPCLPTFIIVCLSDYSLSSGFIFLVKFYLPVVLICICLMNNDVEALILPVFGEMSIQVFCQFFFIGLFVFLLSYKSSLYTLDVHPY